MSEEVAGGGLLARIEEYIGPALADVERIFTKELHTLEPGVVDILEHAARFRGKRLRPLLLLLTAEAAGGINHNHKVLAAVVEMIHTATLVHDDVLDDADTRRHVATVNARWNNETSVLFGDYLFTHAFHLASSLETTYACRLIGRATNIVCEGELAQIHERGNLGLTEEAYFQIIDRKTAELCAVSCRLGAHYAKADSETTEALANFGRSLGMAFQIADDLLDIVGDEQTAGKSLGSDLAKQKLTLPLIRLLSQADEPLRNQVHEMLVEPGVDAWRRLKPILADSDALEYTQRRANALAASAQEWLQAVPDSQARQMLSEIAEFSTHRTF